MAKSCARCEKTVYPIEELKCLDKIWHKQCFKCQVCQMTLNMRNYKGFNKDPYCEAHIPKAKATTVAETPEFRRIAENTKIQSNVKYHADFEKAKGKFTQVADDPETLRMRANSKNISNVAYHGELEKKAFMERQRNIGENEEEAAPMPVTAPAGIRGNGDGGSFPSQVHHPAHQQSAPAHKSHHNMVQQPIAEAGQYNSPYSARQSSTVIYTSDRGPVTQPPDRKIGSIQDLDPVNNFYGSLSSDMTPMNSYAGYGGGVPSGGAGVINGHRRGAAMYGGETDYPPPMPVMQQQHQQSPNRNSGRVFRAMYDYKAQDNDEVSFQDGDLIINCTSIDDGWLTGIVKRTGQHGMLPANYVKPAI